MGPRASLSGRPKAPQHVKILGRHAAPVRRAAVMSGRPLRFADGAGVGAGI